MFIYFFWQQEKFGHECISQKLNGLRDFERREREREAQLKGKEEGEYNKYKNQEPQKGEKFHFSLSNFFPIN